MSLARSLLRGVALVGTGGLLSRLLALGTNLCLAWFLSKRDFGVGVCLALTPMLLQMMTEIGLDRLLVQSHDGGSDRLRGTAQSLLLLRGATLSLLLLLLAPLLARLFDVVQATWAFQATACLPLLNALRNLDLIRVQRNLRFLPTVMADVLPEVVVLAAVYPLAAWLQDYRIFVVLALWRSASRTVLSHLFAERRICFAWDRQDVQRAMLFGWPLMLNGLLMYLYMQGDRAVVAGTYSLEELSAYAIAATLTLAPSMLIVGAVSGPVLPVLAKVQDDPQQFLSQYRTLASSLCFVAGVFGCGAVTLAPSLTTLMYGEKYQAAAVLVFWLGLAQAVRLVRIAPTLAAMAKGDTANSLLANVLRMIGLALAAGAGMLGMPLVDIAVCALLGEAAALAGAAVGVQVRHGVPLATTVEPLALAVLVCGGVCAWTTLVDLPWTAQWGVFGLGLVVLAGLYLATSRERRVAVARCWA